MSDIAHFPRRGSRRQFLRFSGRVGSGMVGLTVLGAGASTVLAACGSTEPSAQPQLVSLFSPSRVIVAGRPQRLPFGLVADGEDAPDDLELPVRILRDGVEIDSVTVSGRVVDHDHAPGSGEHQHANLLRYYPLRTELPEVGIYDLEVSVDAHTITLPVQAFDPREVELPLVGDPFPAIETPTVDDGRGVDPICTLVNGPCAFHQRTATEVMEAGQPMALLVATPAFCSTAYCGPVLGTLIEAATAFPHIGMVHVEPWANPREGEGLTDPGLRTSPAVDALHLTFEPSLFLVDRNGIVAERIDNVFDTTELEAALDALD